MRRNIWLLPVLVVAITSAVAPRVGAQALPDPAAAAAAPGPDPAEAAKQPAGEGVVPDPAKLAPLLALWERNSGKLTTLDVKMTRTDNDPALGQPELYEGRAILKSPNLALLDFIKIVDGKKVPHERIVCTGTEVWQYKNEVKQIFIYPLEKDVQQRALEEGPLPFLFNFRAASAQKRYHIDRVGGNDKFEVLRIIPKEEIDRESFSKAWVQLDRKLGLLPSQIFLLSTDGKSSKDFKLIYGPKSTNGPVETINFVGKAYDGWKVVRNPGGDGKPAANNARPAQAAPVANKPEAAAPKAQPQPAMKPGLLRRR